MIVIAGVATTVAIVAFVSPWPSALIIRAVFDRGAATTLAELQRNDDTIGIRERLDIVYGDAGASTSLDVYTPGPDVNPDDRALPAVVWIHGGAWISGDKANVRPYLRLLAAKGFATVGLNYTDSPDATYPTAVTQLNSALGYLTENAADLGIDPTRIVLAGDSAGANLASQLATLTTSPSYAQAVGIVPSLSPDQLRGVVLNCGIYDVRGIPEVPGLVGWGFRSALWAYLGERDWSKTAGASQMSTIESVDADFPTTWVTGGNGDPLTETQSVPLAARLTELGVNVETVFYPADHEPELPHEYQFKLDFDDAKSALASMEQFLARVTA
jgi:acetyl esterase/lipase